MTGEPRSYNQILYSYFFIQKKMYHLLASLGRGVWRARGGHVYGTWAGVVDWATVHCIVIVDVDTRTIHRSCLRHRSIYSTFGGKAVC